MTSRAHPVPAAGPADLCDPHGGCITCGDEGVEMRVEGVEEDGLGVCATADGAREEVDLALVAPVAPGDLVLVHAKVALVRLDPGPGGAA